jgi:hypothetical protein
MYPTARRVGNLNDLTPYQKFIRRLGGYYLIPHELLHVLAYRLIRKPYRYEWGWPYVIPIAAMTRRERLFTALFPFCNLLWGRAVA